MNTTKYQKKRATLNFKTKKEIIEMGEHGLSHKKIADIFKVGRSTVTKILLKKHIILNTQIGNDRKRMGATSINTLELLLLDWCKANYSWDLNTLLSISDQFIHQHRLNCKIPNHTWLQLFLNKYNLNPINQHAVVKSNLPYYFDLQRVLNYKPILSLPYYNYSPIFTDFSSPIHFSYD